MAHVAVAPYPAQGHIPPMLYLAKKLAAEGAIVTIITIDSIHAKLEKQIVLPAATEMDIRLEQVEFEVKLPMGFDATCNDNRAKFAQTIWKLYAPYESLIQSLHPPVCCIIADEFLPWSKLIAKKMNIPVASYWPGNASWSSLHHHLSLLVDNGDLPFKDTDAKNKLISYIPGLTPLHGYNLPEYLHAVDKKILEDIVIPLFVGLSEATWVLVNSFNELEPETFRAMKESLGDEIKYIGIGPLFPLADDDDEKEDGMMINSSLRNVDDDCLNWLNTQPEKSVLYISFGSISRLNESEFEEMAYGLEESKECFLWVIRPDMLPDSSKKVYEEFKERLKAQGMFVSWAPQLKVLSHNSVGGFLTHCGWNSVFESLCNGVPMLTFPCHSEQRLNSKLIVEDWKIGMNLCGDGEEEKKIEKLQIAAAITKFMNKDETMEMRKRGKQVMKLAYNAVNGGSSFVNFNEFAHKFIM